MSIEAMKQALEALEYYRSAEDYQPTPASEAITALRQAIEQAEMIEKSTKAWADTPDHFRDATKKVVPSKYSNSHQPVAWREIMGKWKTHYYDYNEDGRGEPLYAAPREWVGLTDEDRSELLTQHHGWNEFGQVIESKLKERNT
jgi:hypothetical protein